MKKIYISLLCLSSMPLWGMEELTKTMEDVTLNPKTQTPQAATERLRHELEFEAITIKATVAPLQDEYAKDAEYNPISTSQQIGRAYKDLQKIVDTYQQAELNANKELLQHLVNVLYYGYDILRDELEASVENLQDAVQRYISLPDAAKQAQEDDLIDLYNAVVDRYNAIIDTTMEQGLSTDDDRLPTAYAHIITVKRTLGME